MAATGLTRPRLLDLGAGSGRIGWPFAAAGDDYVGIDLSLGMLHAYLRRPATGNAPPRLVQADGRHLPFADATFDAVMMIQVFGAMRGWRRLLTETRRVLRPEGVLLLGRTLAPDDGVDARLKERLALILQNIGVEPDRNFRDDAERWLDAAARGAPSVTVAWWNSERTPGKFLLRHRTAARFSALPDGVKNEALRRLREWAVATFGSLDAVYSEPHAFALRLFKFDQAAGS